MEGEILGKKEKDVVIDENLSVYIDGEWWNKWEQKSFISRELEIIRTHCFFFVKIVKKDQILFYRRVAENKNVCKCLKFSLKKYLYEPLNSKLFLVKRTHCT